MRKFCSLKSLFLRFRKAVGWMFLLPFGKHILIFLELIERNGWIFLLNKFNHNDKKRIIFVSGDSDDRYKILSKVQMHGGENYLFLILPGTFFEVLYQHHMGKFLLKNSVDNSEIYNTKGVKFQRALSHLYRDLRISLKILNLLVGPNLFISSSCGDSRWRYLSKISNEEIGVPWLVCEREGVLSRLSMEEGVVSAAREFDPYCDFMIVSNNNHAKRWCDIGIDESRIALVGELKSDFWKLKDNVASKKLKVESSQKLVLYFSIGDRNYINSKYLSPDDFSWKELRQQHFVALAKAAEKDDRIKVLVKGGHKGDLLGAKSFFQNRLAPNRFQVFGPEEKAIDLIKSCNLVVGLQTTALIEAQFTQKPVIYAGWGEIHDKLYDKFLLPIKSSDVLCPKNVEQCVENIISCVNNPPKPNVELRKEFIQRYFENPNGDVATRVMSVIHEIIEKGAIPKEFQWHEDYNTSRMR